MEANMQQVVKEFNETKMCHRKKMPESARLLDIQSELGELAKEVLKNTKYGTMDFVVTEDFEMEFGDVLYALLSFANETNIDAKECLEKVLKKYADRIDKNNSMGSGR